MTFNSDTHSNPTTPPDEVGAFEDEFDRLLDQSSLGSPNARAIQAMTPLDVIDTVQSRAEAHARDRKNPDCQVESDCDVDDVLLNLVVSAAQATEHEPGSRLLTYRDTEPDVCLITGRLEGRSWGQRDSWFKYNTFLRTDASRDMLAYLVGTHVFEYVRPDVARSIVEVAFLAPAIALSGIFDGAVARCGIADELIDEVRRRTALDVVTPSSVTPVPPPMVSIQMAESTFGVNTYSRRGGYDLMLLFVFYGHSSAIRVQRRLVNNLVQPVPSAEAGEGRAGVAGGVVRGSEQLAALSVVGTERPSQCRRSEAPGLETSAMTLVVAMLLGLLHEGPQGIRVLLAAMHERMGMSEVTRDRVRRALGALYKSGLVAPTSRIRANRLQSRYRITDNGQLIFRKWLLEYRDSGRDIRVLQLLLNRMSLDVARCAISSKIIGSLDDGSRQAQILADWANIDLPTVATMAKPGELE